jgi:DNA-binding transcriptional LysR family regulator
MSPAAERPEATLRCASVRPAASPSSNSGRLSTRWMCASTRGLAVAVSECDALGVVGRALAEKLADRLRLRIFPPPIPLPAVGVHLVWHRSRQKDAGHRWLREGIAGIFAQAGSRLAA